MALRKKGTRLIAIDAIQYRWTVAPDDEPGVAAVVEHATLPARRLVSWVEHGVLITPAVVRQMILLGLHAGWRPDERGADFVQRLPLDSVERAMTQAHRNGERE